MRLEEARKAAMAQGNLLWKQKNQLTNLLKEPPKNDKNFDRVEISKTLQEVEKAYDLTMNELSDLTTFAMQVEGAESEGKQFESMTKHMQEELEYMLKCMEIYRRISKGGKVPFQDENRLMQYDSSLYMMAKNEAMKNQDKDKEHYESLWKDEEQGEQASPSSFDGLSERASVSLELPEMPEISVDIPTESES